MSAGILPPSLFQLGIIIQQISARDRHGDDDGEYRCRKHGNQQRQLACHGCRHTGASQQHAPHHQRRHTHDNPSHARQTRQRRLLYRSPQQVAERAAVGGAIGQQIVVKLPMMAQSHIVNVQGFAVCVDEMPGEHGHYRYHITGFKHIYPAHDQQQHIHTNHQHAGKRAGQHGQKQLPQGQLGPHDGQRGAPRDDEQREQQRKERFVKSDNTVQQHTQHQKAARHFEERTKRLREQWDVEYIENIAGNKQQQEPQNTLRESDVHFIYGVKLITTSAVSATCLSVVVHSTRCPAAFIVCMNDSTKGTLSGVCQAVG